LNFENAISHSALQSKLEIAPLPTRLELKTVQRKQKPRAFETHGAKKTSRR